MAITLALSACAREAAPARPRHVVLVVVDTLRADRLGCYGYPRDTSPQLDALAAQGSVYLDHRAQGSWTRPSMISLMSGMYVLAPEESLPAAVPTLAERVRATGRSTAAFVGNPLLTGQRGFQRGFDHFEGRRDGSGGGKAAAIFASFDAWCAAQGDALRDGPGLFAWLHVMDPHTPLRPEPRHAALFTDDPPGLPELLPRWRASAGDDDADTADAATADAASADTGGNPDPGGGAAAPDDGLLAHEEAIAFMTEQHDLYDAEVRGLDEAIGTLVASLQARGLWKDTLLIVASDHGEQLWERPRTPPSLKRLMREAKGPVGLADHFDSGHGMSLYDEAWRTPLLLVGPGVPAGVREQRLTANLDLMPTVLDAFGLAPPDDVPGRSLYGGRAPSHEHVFGYSHARVAVVDGRGLKYTDASGWRAGLEPGLLDPGHDGPAERLVDLRADPGEWDDLGPERPDLMTGFRALVEDWRARHDRPYEAALSAEDRRALEALGYVGTDR